MSSSLCWKSNTSNKHYRENKIPCVNKMLWLWSCYRQLASTFMMAFSNFCSWLNSSKMLLACFFFPRKVSVTSSTSYFCPLPVLLGHNSPFLPFTHPWSIVPPSPSSSLSQFTLQFSFFPATSPTSPLRCLNYKLLVQVFSSRTGCSWTLPISELLDMAEKSREKMVMSASLWERHFFLSFLLLGLNEGPNVVMGRSHAQSLPPQCGVYLQKPSMN